MKHLMHSMIGWFSSHPRMSLVSAAVLILLVHILAVTLFFSDTSMPDERRYISIAENLLTTKTFGPVPGVPFAMNPPLYPFFVAALFAISGYSLIVVRIAQAIIGTGNSLVTFGLARTLFPQRPVVAWLSMLSVGLYPVFFLWEGLILTETVYILTIQLCCWWWIRSVQSPTLGSILLAGVGFGLSMLARETLYFLVPVAVLAALLIIRRKRLCYIALFATAYLLTLAPWMVRNKLVFDHMFFTGRTAYLMHSLTGRGYLDPYYQRQDTEYTELGASPQALDMDRLAYTPVHYVRSLSFARQEPVLYVRILAARLFELWLHPNGLNRLPESLRLPYQIGHGLILLLAGAGLWVAVRMRHWPLLVWCLVLPYNTVISVYTKPNPRYTIPFLPLVLILAALALDSGLRLCREKVQQ
jgi:4-amino-4-deoxy-L-arabinose transferase-like glycosyltransferase